MGKNPVFFPKKPGTRVFFLKNPARAGRYPGSYPRQPWLCLCLSVCSSVSICLFICVYLSVRLCLFVCACLPVYLSVCVSICVTICLSACLSEFDGNSLFYCRSPPLYRAFYVPFISSQYNVYVNYTLLKSKSWKEEKVKVKRRFSVHDGDYDDPEEFENIEKVENEEEFED